MVTVKASIENIKYATNIMASGNIITADEPIENGGQGQGFSPSELLASSLAACTSITLRMYADRKEWKLEKAEIEVAFETVDGVSVFTRNIALFGTLDAEQKASMLAIANKCPIHKALSNTIKINTIMA